MIKRNISLVEYYQEVLNIPNPANEVVQKLMVATGRSENAVRCWLYGRHTPEPIFQKIIADTLNLKLDGLFPINLTTKPKSTRKPRKPQNDDDE